MDNFHHNKQHILREDGACIPMSEDNSDYLAYLSWVEEGNTAPVVIWGTQTQQEVQE
jgi:hypothetical protein